MAKSRLAKRKASTASVEASSSSDDEDDSKSRHNSKKNINKILLATALHSKTHLFKKGLSQDFISSKLDSVLAKKKYTEDNERASDTSSMSEAECKANLKVPKQIFENLPSVYSSSEQESATPNKRFKIKPDKMKIKVEKQQNLFNNHDLHEKDVADAKNIYKHTSMRLNKKELSSEDSESASVHSDRNKPVLKSSAKRASGVKNVHKHKSMQSKNETVISEDSYSATSNENQSILKNSVKKQIKSGKHKSTLETKKIQESSEASEVDSSDSDNNCSVTKNREKHVVLHSFKQEVLTEDSDLDVESKSEHTIGNNNENGSFSSDSKNDSTAESELNHKNIDKSTNNRNTNKILKTEPESNNFSSESENEGGKTSDASKLSLKNSTLNNSSIENKRKDNKGVMDDQQQSDSDSDGLSRSRVTVLQDIRLTPKSKTPKQRLKEMYPGLQVIETEAALEISDTDEIHLFITPKNVVPQLLKKAEIDLESECKINLGEKYIITPTTEIPNPTLVISANSRVLQFKNTIRMKKYIKSKKEHIIRIPERKSVPLPENSKNRNPLFGSDFQHKLNLNESVENKLDKTIANYILKRERRSKKKKDKQNRHREEEKEPDQEILNLLGSCSFLTNNDRVKKETSDDSAFGSSNSVDNLKRKSKKEKRNTSDREVKQEMEHSIENELTEQRSSSSKRKKKTKISHDHDWPNVSDIKKEVADVRSIKTEPVSTSHKKDKKDSSVIHSTFMSDILRTPKFSPEVSTIVSEASTSEKKPTKSKKDKKLDVEVSVKKEKLISDLLNDVSMELHLSTKSKKKKRKHEDIGLSKTVKIEF